MKSVIICVLLFLFIDARSQSPQWIHYTWDAAYTEFIPRNNAGKTKWAPLRIEFLFGERFFPQKRPVELVDHNVTSITVDGAGNKWIGTSRSGVTKFNGAEFVVYDTFNSELLHPLINSIALDRNGDLWFGTGDGVSVFDGTSWKSYTTVNIGIDPSPVMSVVIDQAGAKWIQTWNAFARYNQDGWKVFNHLRNDMYLMWFDALEFDMEGVLWIGTMTGLAKFDGKEFVLFNSYPRLEGVASIVIDSAGNKWAGALRGGLAKFDGVNWTYYDSSNSGLPKNRVSSLAIDKSGNIWMGSHGLTKFDGVNWTVYNTSNSEIPDNIISAITIDLKGNKWIGTRYGGLSVFNENGVDLLPDDVFKVDDYVLSQNYPNPFNSQTRIRYKAAAKGSVNLEVYNILGERVCILVNQIQEQGEYNIIFNGENLASGVYTYTLRMNNTVLNKKMILIK